ncbi:MAG: hypothetical protein M5U12_09680 [Verrucomicrobia bacterium]|nr:hypothetical protein [Verrucomicrobiota bacterium]
MRSHPPHPGRRTAHRTTPLDDPKTYALLNSARTLGVFQLESGGMRDLCRKFQIGSIEHITALIALYRPGPMDLIPEFLRRRHGEVRIEYPHPLLEPIARETYGIMVYQEQVMQAAQVLAGYTLGGADLLRRAMGKKNKDEMATQRAVFVRGCADVNQIPVDKANAIFDLLEKFAGYGFNKSHAAAYAFVAYQTAYLKANYPVEFLCAMMTNDMADTEKLGLYIAEARELGLQVLPPDVNESDVFFAPAADAVRPQPPAPPGGASSPPATSPGGAGFQPAPSAPSSAPPAGAIRFGLAAIKGIGEAAVESLLEARRAAVRSPPWRISVSAWTRAPSTARSSRPLSSLAPATAWARTVRPSGTPWITPSPAPRAAPRTVPAARPRSSACSRRRPTRPSSRSAGSPSGRRRSGSPPRKSSSVSTSPATRSRPFSRCFSVTPSRPPPNLRNFPASALPASAA